MTNTVHRRGSRQTARFLQVSTRRVKRAMRREKIRRRFNQQPEGTR